MGLELRLENGVGAWFVLPCRALSVKYIKVLSP